MCLDAVIFLSLPPLTVAKYCYATLHSVSTNVKVMVKSRMDTAFTKYLDIYNLQSNLPKNIGHHFYFIGRHFIVLQPLRWLCVGMRGSPRTESA